MYAPMTRTYLMYGLVAMRPAPSARPVGKDAQAHPKSTVPAFTAPILCCTTTDVAGVM